MVGELKNLNSNGLYEFDILKLITRVWKNMFLKPMSTLES